MVRYIPAFLLLLTALPTAAQEIPPDSPVVRPGVRVRVEAPGLGSRRVGEVVRADADSLVLQHGADRLSIPWSSVSTLEISAGRRSNSTGVGALLGAVAGGAAFGLMAATTGDYPNDTYQTVEGAVFVYGGMGLLAGGVAGAALEEFFNREKWRKILPRPTAFLPRRRRITFEFSVPAP